MLRPSAGADRPFGYRRRVRVVVDRHRQPEVLLRAFAQRNAREWDVDREHRRALTLVDRRGNADADGGHAVVAEGFDDLDEPVAKRLRGLGRRVPPLGAEHRAVALDHTREDLRAADVDADGALDHHDRRLP